MLGKARLVTTRFADRFNLGITGNDEDSKSRRTYLIFLMEINLFAPLYGGNFLNGLYLQTGVDNSFIAILTMITQLANMLQLFAPLVLERFVRRKKFLIFMRMIMQSINIVVIALVAFMPGGVDARRIMLLLCVVSVNVINATIASGYSIWHVNNVPNEMRARFFSTQNIFCGIISTLMAIFGGLIADKIASLGNELMGLLILRAVAFIGLVLEIPLLIGIKEFPNTPMPKVNIKAILTQPWKKPKYILTTLCAVAWSFAANIPGPYFGLYVLHDLKLSYTFLNMLPLIYLPFLIFASGPWTKFIQKYSWLKVLQVAIMCYSAHYILLGLVGGNSIYFYPIALVMAYTFSPAINICFANLPYLEIPAENQSIYVGFYSAMNSMAAFLGITAGRVLFGIMKDMEFMFLGIKITSAQMLVGITSVMVFLSSIVVLLANRGIKRLDAKEKADEADAG